MSSTAYITRQFLLGQYASIDELQSTVGLGCENTAASPPGILVPVLSLTQTETSYEQSQPPKTSAAGNAAPSKPIIAPTVTPTSFPQANPQKTPPTLPKSPIVDSPPTKPDTPRQTTTNVDIPPHSSPEAQSFDQGPSSNKDLPPLSLVVGSELHSSQINNENAKDSKVTSIFIPFTNSPESKTPSSTESTEAFVNAQAVDVFNDLPQPKTPSLPENIIQSSISAGRGNEELSQDLPTDRPVFGSQVEARPTPTSQVFLPGGSSVISATLDGDLVTKDQTPIPVGSLVTASGKSIYLQTSNTAAVIDGSTVSIQQGPPEPSYSTPPIVLSIGSSPISANPEGNFVIESQTLVPGGSPVTALGKSIYLQPSGSAAVIDGNTVALAQAPQILTFGSRTLEKEKAGGYMIGSQTLVPGDAPITVAGAPISLAPSASALIVGSTTIVQKADPKPLIFGAEVLGPDGTGGYTIGSQTLFPGRAPITIDGTPLSLAPSASVLIFGSQTLTQEPLPSLPSVIVYSAKSKPNTVSEYLIAGQTLVAGAPPISISGQPVSLAPGESQVVIGSSTQTLTSENSGLASLILQGLGNVGSDATPTTPNSTPTSPTLAAQYTGSAGLGKWTIGTTWIGLSILLMGFRIMI